MNIPDKEYDFVIVGSGLGGLVCGAILSKEGHSVIVLEKNNQLGGNLQVFSRDKSIFDTGVHYVGGLDDGQVTNKLFRYLGIYDQMKMKRMDPEAFDIIRFGDGKEYKYGQGYDAFKKNLKADFPEEEKAIDTYCDTIQEICLKFPMYNLDVNLSTDYFNQMAMREVNAYDFIASLTDNIRLRNVLAGNNPLYAGIKEKTPLYVHALILNHYIISSYKFVDGGSQIATALAKRIRAHGGEVFKRTKVTGANYNEDDSIKEVVLESGQTVRGKNFISNMHPALTIDVFGEDRFLNAYKKRIRGLENSLSTFTLHLTFKKDAFEYLNHNIYQYFVEDVWAGIDYSEAKWPEGYFISTPASSKSEKYADAMSVMTYMHIRETEKWSKSFNTVGEVGDRGQTYEEFKREKEEKIIVSLEKVFPGIRDKILNVYSSTPLTFRDYIGTEDGSMYGIVKDSENPIKTFINPKTKIPNLYLTGQNLILHGILGVTIGAVVTCFFFTDRERIVKEIRNA